MAQNTSSARTMRRIALPVLLLVTYIGVLYTPFYNSVEPNFMGIPFFYWYQMMWIFISAILTGIMYAIDR